MRNRLRRVPYRGFTTNPLRVAVLMGGVSSEREISLRSGNAIASALESRGHEVSRVDIRCRTLADQLQPDLWDVAFIALHGCFGEDGLVQAQCEEMGLAYTGSGPKASGLAMDKVRAKELFMGMGLTTPAFAVVRSSEPQEVLRVEKLGYPLVIKPPLEGSSIGLSIVRTPDQIVPAITEALRYGSCALAEKFIAGRELTVGILGESALPIVQVVPKKGVYDYHAKYTPGQTEYWVPAPLEKKCTQRVQAAALAAFRGLECEDFGRVDVMVGEEETPFILEVNTIPGFTETSLLPKAAAASGIAFAELCERIARMGLLKSAVVERAQV